MADELTTKESPESPNLNNADTPASGSTDFFHELKRRQVVRVASVYALVAWLIIQVAETTFDSFGIPAWAFRFVVITLALGFPVSLIIAWALELTPEGFRLTHEAGQIDEGSAESMAHQSKNRWLAIVFAAAVPTLIFAGLVLVFNLRPSGDASLAGSPEPAELSIAVLPLVNMSDIDANSFFAGGVHEDILTNLSHIDNLHVISRTSVMRYLNSDMSLRDIGVALGARYIVEGSVRRINNHVRVSVQLIDALKDKHLWANNYDRELVDVFATQSAVAREISNSVHLEIQPETVGTLQGMPTRSVKAYDLYIKAKSIDRSEPESESSLTRRRELLEAAVEEDPGFVEAWGFLNEILDDSIRNMIQQDWFLPEGADRDSIYTALQGKALHALNKAVALDAENIETLLAMASDFVAEQASADFRAERRKVIDTAIEKFPDNAMAWYVLGWWYSLNDDLEAAKPAFLKALELDPLHARIVFGSLLHFRQVGEQELTTMLFERLTQIAPEKGEDQSLGRASIAMKLEALQDAFRETADQSLIDTFAEEMAKSGVFASELEERIYKTTLWELQNNIAALLGEDGDVSLSENANIDELREYLLLNLRLLYAQRLAGHTDNASVIARRIVATENLPLLQNANVELFHMMLASAYATLGERDAAQALVDKLLNERSESYDAYGLFGFYALAELDIDRAVTLILDEKTQHPSWPVTDIIASYHVLFRNILVHPNMQAYYVKEGKWVDYLAERVPEYAQYKK